MGHLHWDCHIWPSRKGTQILRKTHLLSRRRPLSGGEQLILFIKNQKILGGSMIAPNACELMQELVLANSTGLTHKHLFQKIYAYPTGDKQADHHRLHGQKAK
ncbi:MAG: hypothetical protein ACQESG_00950 [Nanobdellota archaeon]